MIVSANQGVHIGVGAVLRGVAQQNGVAQLIHALGQVDAVALSLHGGQGVLQGLKYRQIGGTADVSSVGWKVKQHDGHFACAAFAALQGHEFAHPRGQHEGTLGTAVHVLGGGVGAKGAGMVATRTGHARSARPAAKDDGAGRTIELGNRHHDGALHRHQAAIRAAPLVQGLKLHRVRRHIGHVELGQHLFGAFGVVVRGATNQRKASE